MDHQSRSCAGYPKNDHSVTNLSFRLRMRNASHCCNRVSPEKSYSGKSFTSLYGAVIHFVQQFQ